MGILDDLGVGDAVPKIELTGFFSNTWIWVLVVVLVGLILIGLVGWLVFMMTFNKKVILFENITGQGYQPVLKTRARTIKLGVGGEELLKLLWRKTYVSAYGRKMGKNTYWYAKGQDGYWYNIVIGDLDTKQAMLDIDPIDRDVRMFHVALDRLSHQTYGKQSFMEKYGIHMMLFLFLIVMILGLWFIVGKIGDAVAPLSAASDNALKVQEANIRITNQLEQITRNMGITTTTDTGGSGLQEAGT